MVLAGRGRLSHSKAALAIRRISVQGNSFPGAVAWHRTTGKSQRQAGKEQQRKRVPAWAGTSEAALCYRPCA